MDQDIDLAKLLVGKLDGKERQVSRFFALKKMVSIRHARYGTFQMAEVLVSRSLFYEILERIKRLKPVPNWI